MSNSRELVLAFGDKKLLVPRNQRFITIGRHSDNTIPIILPEVSRYHCYFDMRFPNGEGNEMALYDGKLGVKRASTFGTYVAQGPNRQFVPLESPLDNRSGYIIEPGISIRLGDKGAPVLVLEYQEEAPRINVDWRLSRKKRVLGGLADLLGI